MTTAPDAWVPIKLRVRHVIVGDVVIGKGPVPWMVTELLNHAANPSRYVTVRRGADEVTTEMDLDDTLKVLVAVPERDTMRLLRDELGAKLIERTAIEAT